MKTKTIIFCLYLLSVNLSGLTQATTEKLLVGGDTALVNALLQQSTDQRNIDPGKSLELALQARELAEKINFQKGVAYSFKNIGLAYLIQAK